MRRVESHVPRTLSGTLPPTRRRAAALIAFCAAAVLGAGCARVDIHLTAYSSPDAAFPGILGNVSQSLDGPGVAWRFFARQIERSHTASYPAARARSAANQASM